MILVPELFLDKALDQVPRILGLGDRQEASVTYGCFDRSFWHYKLSDFPNARFQEVCLMLALLFALETENNRYAQKKVMRNWCVAVIDFWLKNRNPDGSIAEAFPYERSFCATAFGLLAISETVLILSLAPPDELIKSATWLCCHDNVSVSNQQASACVALYNCFLIFNDNQFFDVAQSKLSILLRSREKNGYFPEYGGFDLGYTTVTLSCLANLNKKIKSPRLTKTIEKTCLDIEGLVDEYSWYDCRAMSRRTQFVYPFAFAATKSPVIDKLQKGITSDRVIHPGWLDDRYVIQLVNDYLMTYQELKSMIT